MPVFIQYFGLVLMLVSGGMYFGSKVKFKNAISEKRVLVNKYICLMGLFLFTLVAGYSNYRIVKKQNYFWLYPRKIIEDAIDNNLFKNVPVDSLLIVNGNYPWDNTGFYAMKMGRCLYDVTCQGNYLNVYKDSDFALKSKNIYYLRYNSDELGNGYVVLSQLIKVRLGNENILAALGNDAKIYCYSAKSEINITQVTGFEITM